jgi:hypothetical protein
LTGAAIGAAWTAAQRFKSSEEQAMENAPDSPKQSQSSSSPKLEGESKEKGAGA